MWTQAHCFSKPDVLGICVSVAETIGLPDVEVKPFISEGEAKSCGFPPDYGLPCQGRVYGEIVSHPLLHILMWIFSHLLNM